MSTRDDNYVNGRIIDDSKSGYYGSPEYDKVSYVLHLVDDKANEGKSHQKLLLGKYMESNIPNIAVVISHVGERQFALDYIRSAKKDNPLSDSKIRIFVRSFKGLSQTLVHKDIKYKVIAFSYLFME